MMEVKVLYFDGCPHWRTAADRLAAMQAELGFELTSQRVATPEEAELVGFRGSPTIQVDGIDPFAPADAPIGFACRVFSTPEGAAGSPTIEQLRKALSR